MGKKKNGKKPNVSASGASSAAGAGKSFCGEAAAAVSGSAGVGAELLQEPWSGTPPDRDEDGPRPTIELEKRMATQIAKTLVKDKIETTVSHDKYVPNVDLPSVVEQMQRERDVFFGLMKAGATTYHDLVKYGIFLKNVRTRLADEHKRGTQKQLVAKALADRARGEREWSQRSAALERANHFVTKLVDASTHLNKHVGELQVTPCFVRAMAELRARDMVQPGWDRSFAPAPRKEDDVADDISFEALLLLEKESGTFGGPSR
jgi:hypothetical protein